MKINIPVAISTPSYFSGSKKESNSNLAGSGADKRDRMFVFGMGYVGRFLGGHLKNRGWMVTGTCTTDAKKKELEKQGLDAYLFRADDAMDVAILEMAKCHTHVLVSIPPSLEIGDPVLYHQNILIDSLSGGNLKWLGYLSSTSVYGDSRGSLIDEEFRVYSTSDAAKLRLAAEDGWLSFGHLLGISSHVFRLGGVYGPGRSAIDTLSNQKPQSESQKKRASKRYTSRVHVYDVCQVLEACISLPSSRRLYNIVDDDPAPRDEVFAYAQNLISKKWPGVLKDSQNSKDFGAWDANASSWIGQKRVSNARLKSELGVKLLYPSYKSGLLSVLDELKNLGP